MYPPNEVGVMNCKQTHTKKQKQHVWCIQTELLPTIVHRESTIMDRGPGFWGYKLLTEIDNTMISVFKQSSSRALRNPSPSLLHSVHGVIGWSIRSQDIERNLSFRKCLTPLPSDLSSTTWFRLHMTDY